MSAFKIVVNTTTRSDAFGLARVWPADSPGGEKWVEIAWFVSDPYQGPMGGRPIGRQATHPLSYWEGEDHNGHTWVAYDATEAEARHVARW